MNRLPYEYPPWIPPAPQPSEPSRPSINSTDSRDLNIMAAAVGSPIPIAYGRVELAPLIFAVATQGTDLVLGCAWCLGEIEDIEQIYDDDAPITAAWVTNSYKGVSGQGVDPTLAAAIPGYADTLETTIRGETVTVAYSVLKFPATSDFPRIKAIIKGKRSWSGGAIFFPEVDVANTATASLTFSQWSKINWKLLAAATNPSPTINDQDYTTSSSAISYSSDVIWELAFPASDTFYTIKYNIRTTNEFYHYTQPYSWSVQYHDGAAWQTAQTVDNQVDGTHTVRFPSGVTTDRVRLVFNGARREIRFTNGTRTMVGPIGEVAEIEVYAKRQSQYAYTANPAVVLSDFCSSKAYGLGREVDPTSLQQAVDFCDELMPDGFPRQTVGIALIRRASVTDHIETLRAYANCFVASIGGKVYLIPNRPAPVSGVITEDMIVEGTFSMTQISMQNAPTVIALTRTDASAWPWKEPTQMQYHPDVLAGTLDYREQSLKMPGIHHEGQADRTAIQRLNYYTLINLRVSCVVFDEGLNLTVGDVVEVSHQWGLVRKPMRVISQEAAAPGRYRLELEEYDPKVYSGAIETTPSYPDTGLQEPADVPTVRALEGSLGGTMLQAFWEGVDDRYPYGVTYAVEARQGGAVVASVEVSEPQVMIDSVASADEVAVRVKARWAGVDYTGPWATVAI